MDRRRNSLVAHGRLDDGTEILFRTIRAEDKDLLARGFELLSPTSRYLRFFRAIDHLSDAQLHYLTEVDLVDHFAWIAVIPGPEGEFGLGVGRWIRLKDDPAAAEAAVTVIDVYQHRGLGIALLWLLAHSAIERGVFRFRTYTLAQNKAVLEMVHALGAVPGHWESGVMEIDVPLPETAEELDRHMPPVIAAGAAG